MIELRALGTLALRDANGEDLHSVLAQPKRVALLVYLAMARPRGFHRRDTLLALLWPEQDEQHARWALNQSLHHLRTALGKEAVPSRGDGEIGIDIRALSCDAVELEAAIEADDPARALGLYRGDLLEGFHVSGGGEFERWLEEERVWLRCRAARAAAALAHREEARGAPVAAGHWARRALALAPDDEGEARSLIELLGRLGDRAGAVQAYEEFARRLRHEYEVDPAPETLATITAVRTRLATRPAPAAAVDQPRGSVGPVAPEPSPADGFATAKQFAEALAEPDGPVAHGPGPHPRRRWAWIATAAGLLAVLLGVALARFGRSPSARLDRSLMAVFPFRLIGTDMSYDALREGMVDFLEVKFSGAGGARVVPARTAVAAWRRTVGPQGEDLTQEEASGVARGLGAGALVLGTIVATPGRLILSGSLLDAEAGRVRVEAKVEGTPDSLHSLVDRFAAQLAALGAGERPDRLASLTSTSLPALYAYLAGKAAHRAGQYDTAVRHLGQALELDSTFARAALGYHQSVGWTENAQREQPRALRLAWTHRDRLGSRDQVHLKALAGPRYPEPPLAGELVQAWEDAVRQVPDDPDLWIYLGDAYVHAGAMAGVEEPFRRAAEALNRALALDTALNVEPMFHLLQIAGMKRDTATVRRLINRVPEDAPESALHRLQAGAVLGDSAMLAAARLEFDSIGDVTLLLQDAQLFGLALQEAERGAAVFLKQSASRPDRLRGIIHTVGFYHQLGRPAAAAAAFAQLGPPEAIPARAFGRNIAYALYGYVDTAAAAEALGRLAPSADGPVARDSAARDEQYQGICFVQWWRLAHGDTRTARAAIARLAGGKALGCGVMLEALLAAAEHRADAGAAFDRLDTLLAGGGLSSWVMELARWREAQGDVGGALRATRRRAGYDPMWNLSYCLREEGRLAALVGDREGAIEAYSRYLALRYKPEPSVKPEVDRVRAAMAGLVGEPR